jgi:transcriptional regulator with XRE-family HTH domain
MKTPHTKTGSTEIDAVLGGRIRQRRRELTMTQQALADQAGVSFQQKYESGASRVSASMLLTLSQALRTSVQYYYQELADDPDPRAEKGR